MGQYQQSTYNLDTQHFLIEYPKFFQQVTYQNLTYSSHKLNKAPTQPTKNKFKRVSQLILVREPACLFR